MHLYLFVCFINSEMNGDLIREVSVIIGVTNPDLLLIGKWVTESTEV